MTIQTFLTQVCEHCGLESDQVAITVEESDEVVSVQLDVPADDSGLFIGFHGDTLASLQRMLRLIFQKDTSDKKIQLNINDYKQQRNEKLQQLTQTVAQRVLETGYPQTLNTYFPAHERFVIHSTLSDNELYSELESVSFGEGMDRKVTIRLKIQQTVNQD